METVAESGKGEWSPVSKHQIQPGCGERVDWRGTGRPNLTRETKLSGGNNDRENSVFFPCSADNKQDWQSYPVDAQSAVSDDLIHTHTYIYIYLNHLGVVAKTAPIFRIPLLLRHSWMLMLYGSCAPGVVPQRKSIAGWFYRRLVFVAHEFGASLDPFGIGCQVLYWN